MNDADKRVQPVANLREFFRDTLHGALVRQHLSVEDQTEHYVVNLLRCSPARRRCTKPRPMGCG